MSLDQLGAVGLTILDDTENGEQSLALQSYTIGNFLYHLSLGILVSGHAQHGFNASGLASSVTGTGAASVSDMIELMNKLGSTKGNG